jgi:16S rRNA A1518/A1519 N6-dimethyltransferase RsmA/KsgA/DIM1 with predicted DNA glycosylase/AP lyase activity
MPWSKSARAWRHDRAAAGQLRHLHVVELDRDLVERLKKRFSAERLTVHSATR